MNAPLGVQSMEARQPNLRGHQSLRRYGGLIIMLAFFSIGRLFSSMQPTLTLLAGRVSSAKCGGSHLVPSNKEDQTHNMFVPIRLISA